MSLLNLKTFETTVFYQPALSMKYRSADEKQNN